jgi:formamidopyrimidine-DNA glycosylase
MPELPEVETVVSELRPHLVGRRILAADILWPRTLAAPDLTSFVERLRGRVITRLGRRGKHLLFELDSGESLIIHLRMTGRLEIAPADSQLRAGPHVRAWFDLSGGECLVFSDARKFGRVWLVRDPDEVLGALGPEPLDWTFDARRLTERIGGHRTAVKTLLLDQAVVAGIGNIYADEALFLAGIHPLRSGASLNDDEIARLYAAIRQVLREAIAQQGTTLRDYRPPYSAEGAYRNSLRVYQQTGRPCPRCGAPIERIRVTQRSTHFCPHCQPPAHTIKHLIILHTNDIHGRVEGLARVAALVQRTREEEKGSPVFYFDAGDVEEPTCRLSNLTSGSAMHRLLSAAGCDAAAVGNGGWLRYGPQVVGDHADAARYPLLQANLRVSDGNLLPGTQPAAILRAGPLRVGLIGVTAHMEASLDSFGLHALPVLPLTRELAASLRQDGAELILVLSHMGLPADRELAAGLQDDVLAVIGGHSHDLLPEGERVGRVLVAQAGKYAEHLGRVEIAWTGTEWTALRASVLPVEPALQPSPAVEAEARIIEAECQQFMDEVIGELAEALDFALDRECGVADWMADVLRERMDAEVAIVAAGQAFSGPLPAGPLHRGTLWDVCSSTANPGIVMLTGVQLAAVIAKGLDPAFAATTDHVLRGSPRGLLHISGATVRGNRLLIAGKPVDPQRLYRVAGTDWEFEKYGGYADPAWGLRPRYDMPTILREALEAHAAIHRPVEVELGRLGG